VPAEVQVGRSDGWLLNDRIRLIDPLRKSPAPAGLFYGYRAKMSRLSQISRACTLALAIGLLHGAPTASAGTRYVDGISDQSLPAWASSLADGSFANLFAGAWVGQITLARYVVQWNAMAQASNGPNADGDYRERFEAWLRDVDSLGLAPVLALTSYTGVHPASAGEYRARLQQLLEEADDVGEPIGYVEAWNEPNNQGDVTAVNAAAIANLANSVCERWRCQVIAGDLEDTPLVTTYEHVYIRALDFAPAIWGIHPYYSVKAHDDATILRFEQALPNHGAGGQLWFTEIGAYYCTRGQVRGEARQAADVSYLEDTLIPAIAPAHVFYYGLIAAYGAEVPCTASGGDDSELYRADGQPRAAASVILSASADRPFLPGSDLSDGLLQLASATPSGAGTPR